MWYTVIAVPDGSRDGTSGSDNALHRGHGAIRLGDELQDQHGEGTVKAIAGKRQRTGVCLLIEMRLSVLWERAYPT
jgi:hypothetical protein